MKTTTALLEKPSETQEKKRSIPLILWLSAISRKDIALVGGKCASLGEMHGTLSKKGIIIPNAFAITTEAYWLFLKTNGLDKQIKLILKDLDTANVALLARAGKKIRDLILKTVLPKELEEEILLAYTKLSKQCGGKEIAVAVRSSATAEDLPNASFAGQQESYLNIRGKKEVLFATKKCIASLFTDRAISYREIKGFNHLSVALSVTVQQFVDSSAGASGVMFTLDTESGFQGVTLVTAAYGLGEYVVQGRVRPDQYYVWKHGLSIGKKAVISQKLGSKEVKLIATKNGGTKQVSVPLKDRQTATLSVDEIILLAKWGSIIESHYGCPQDIEWVKDGKTGNLFVVQARPETVKAASNHSVIEQYLLKSTGKELLRGVSIGQKIGAGTVRLIDRPSDMKRFKKGDVLVTRITDPNWEPIMRLAAAIITEQGGKTSHAAIVSRELGVPCVVGAKDARQLLKKQKNVTVVCSAGEQGIIYKDILPFEVKKTVLTNIPKTKTKLMMNVGDPDNAFQLSFLPHDGVGLAREEFIFTNFIRIHPLALLQYHKLKNPAIKKQIDALTVGYKKKTDYFVDRLADGVGRIAAAMHPHDVIIRLSDFKSNEYATLIGGKAFEPKEENPMLGWRGASRYSSKEYKEAFALECKAIKRARDTWGLENIIIMVPFCRTPEEGRQVLETMASCGLKQGENGLKIYVMCEIPANVILAEEFCKLFDGLSIGSNDLTQLTLGVDRDSARVGHLYDERNPAVAELIEQIIRVGHRNKRHVGICGQAPSDYPEFAEFLVRAGIDSISLNPDTLVSMRKRVAQLEQTVGKRGDQTNGKMLGLVAMVGIVAAGFIGLGAGCQVVTPEKNGSDRLVDTASPAQLRERVTEKIKAEKDAERQKETVKYTENNFAAFTLSYPTGWEIEHGNDKVTFRNASSGEYISIFSQETDHSTSTVEKTETVIGGKQGFAYRGTSHGEEKSVFWDVEIPVDTKTVIKINTLGLSAEAILKTIQFTDSGETRDLNVKKVN